MHDAKIEYSKINNYIYLGTDACCKVHFKDVLLKKGIRADISLEEERLDAPYGVKYFLWLPLADKLPLGKELLTIGTRAIKNFVDNKIKVYVHCRNGHGRSPELVAAYFVTEGMRAKEALEFVISKRPEVHLNKIQIEDLQKFEKSLK